MQLRSLQSELQKLSQAQQEAVSGRRVGTVSDDPVDAAQIMRFEAGIRDIERYRRNVTAATTRLTTEELVVGSAQELLQKVKDLAIGVASLAPDDPRRQAALAEIALLRDQFLALANTRIGNEYIFGGGQTTSAPFKADGSYVGDTMVRQTEIDVGVFVNISHPGDKLFAQSIQSLDELTTQLGNGSADDISAVVADLNAAQDQLLATQAEMGALLGHIKKVDGVLAVRGNHLLDRRESLRDIQPAEALLRLTQAQTALERAYAVLGRAVSVHLVDFLR